jgi:hypothetical protein
MSADATGRRWAGRVLASGVAVVVGIGLAPGTATAAPATAPAAASLPAQSPAPLPAQDVADPDTTSSVRASWESRGRPHRMAIIRPQRIDVVTEGRITRQVPHSPGPVSIAELDRALPGSWLTATDGTAVLGTAVVLVRDAVLEVGGPGSDLRTLQLVGGATPADAASIHTGGGQVTLTGVAVTSVDLATRQPVAPTAAGRPMIVVSTRGRLESTDVTISDLGTTRTSTDDGDAGVEFHAGSGGFLVRTTLQRNSTGVELVRSEGVHLEDVTATESTGDGIVFDGDRGTTMSGIRAMGNGGNGVLATGESSGRPIGGIVTSGNREYGVAVVGQAGIQVTGVVTEADLGGGLRVSRSSDIVVTDFTATGQRTGVFTHVNSTGIVLDGVHTSGGGRGLVTEKSTDGLEVRNSTFTGARVAGVAIGGKDIALNAVQVQGSRAGVRVERGAHDVRLTGVVLEGGRDGIVTAPDTTGVVLTDLVVDHVESDAVRTFSPDARITGARITGGATGIDTAAATTITDTTITAAEQGIHSRSPDLVQASRVTVDTVDLGINSAPGSPLLLTDSSVHALESVRGDIDQQGVNDLSLPPLNLLSAIGLPLILLAFVLEEIHSVRQRRLGGNGVRRRHPPLPMGAA